MFDLTSTSVPEITRFKIKSHFTNSMTLLSPTITFTVYCSWDYPITEVVAPFDPQIVVDGTSSGYVLPEYTHPQIAGCPITNLELSLEGGNIVTPSDLEYPVEENGKLIVKPVVSNTLAIYVFYVKITAEGVYSPNGDSFSYFGPYQLNVGCFSSQVIYGHGDNYVDNIPLFASNRTATCEIVPTSTA